MARKKTINNVEETIVENITPVQEAEQLAKVVLDAEEIKPLDATETETTETEVENPENIDTEKTDVEETTIEDAAETEETEDDVEISDEDSTEDEEETETEEAVEEETGNKKEYIVLLGAPSFFVIEKDGKKQTILQSNTHKRGDIVTL